MQAKQKQVYVSDDGKEFLTEAECRAHEQREKDTLFWVVAHNFDLTEGRGHLVTSYIKASYPDPYLLEAALRDYCTRKFCREIQFIQGNTPVRGWLIKRITKQEFDNRPQNWTTIRPGLDVCDRPIFTRTLAFGEGEEGLVEVKE